MVKCCETISDFLEYLRVISNFCFSPDSCVLKPIPLPNEYLIYEIIWFIYASLYNEMNEF